MVEYNYIKEFIEQPIKKNWEQNALSDFKGATFTYGDVAKKIHLLHKLFEIWRIKQGDKIALLGRNNSNWGIIYLAVVSYGAVIVPILPDFSPTEVHNIVNHSDSVLLFAGDMVWSSLNQAEMPNLKVIISVVDFSVLVSHCETCDAKFKEEYDKILGEVESLTPEKVSYPEIPNSELAVISYTSGTTGFSKGVMLTLNSLAANIDYARNNMHLVAGDNIVSFLPLAHAFGCAFEFLFPFAQGCHITFLTRIPSPPIIMEAFAKVRPRLVLTVPLVIEKIFKKQIQPKIETPAMKVLLNIPLINRLIFNKINEKLSSAFGGNFHEIVIGGAALNPDVEKFLRRIRFKYTVGYGMTECGPLISYSGWRTNPMGSCGKVINYLELKIDSKDPFNEVGEILVRGENVMLGYYKNPEATSKTIIDGWLHTGDLGILDKNGFIFIKGRSKSMILGPSGQNIYPEEIEARLNNIPFVQESLVVEQKGKLIGLVYPDFESVQQHGINPDELEPALEEHRKEVNKHLPQYSQISKLVIHNQEFEKTPKKSIKRFKYQYSEN
ncbi:MAG: long-chain acyl-CoA synthetase [Tenuifilum sp.]|jgi:long-chain acyl-CoA synthetase|uniref:AMP-binding protein n=1 Tax=Tenuifilum sp. TaxID=2760880 RepID=UPI0024AB4CE7|nr:AMP-binding protein [Tenuifilum sp.]MDI3526830.1 long-chain acyl-CoA synthetase [Tenuifilum sp.]